MSKFIGGIVIAAIPVILAVIGTFAAPAAGSPSCMTLEEARKAFPHDHIYWHGRQHCWDNSAQRRSQTPAAHASAAAAAAKPAEVAAPNEPPVMKLSEALAERPSAPIVIPPVPFRQRRTASRIILARAERGGGRSVGAGATSRSAAARAGRGCHNRRAGRCARQPRIFAVTLLLAAVGGRRSTPG